MNKYLNSIDFPFFTVWLINKWIGFFRIIVFLSCLIISHLHLIQLRFISIWNNWFEIFLAFRLNICRWKCLANIHSFSFHFYKRWIELYHDWDQPICSFPYFIWNDVFAFFTKHKIENVGICWLNKECLNLSFRHKNKDDITK